MTDLHGLLIGDFARRCRLPVSTLRYYDKIGLLVPAVVDPLTGYRRYTAEQLASAVMISRLRAIGTTPENIARVLAGGKEALRAFADERRRIEGQIRGGQRALRELDDLVTSKQGQGEHQIQFVKLEEEEVAAVPLLAPQASLGSAVLRGIAALRSALRRSGCTRRPPWGAMFPLEITEPANGLVFTRTVQPVVLPGLRTSHLPATQAAQTAHHGGPDTLWLAYRAALDSIDAHGGRPSGPVIEEYLSLDTSGVDGAPIRVTVPLATSGAA